MTNLGTVSCKKIQISEDSLSLDQVTDVAATSPSHNAILMYKDTAVDSDFTSGWHATSQNLHDLNNVGSQEDPSPYDLLAWNNDQASWGNVSASVLIGEMHRIAKLVSFNMSYGNAAKTDLVMFSDSVVSLGSAQDHNAIYKRETTETSFSFVQTMSKGEVLTLNYPVGTILRSTRGTYGITGTLYAPLGISCLSVRTTKFFTSADSRTVWVAGLGEPADVTLFAADMTTVLDGPIRVEASGIGSLTANDHSGEIVLSSSVCIVAAIDDDGMRILPPMTSLLITWNKDTSIISLQGSANVQWFRRNGDSGTVTVTEGTPKVLSEAGSDDNFAPDGCIILKSDKPIASNTGDVPGWPIEHLSQSFCNPGTTCEKIVIASPYEGSAHVYDSSGSLVSTFDYTRGSSVSNDQNYPACGALELSLNGGYIECNTPAVCVLNFDALKNIVVPGSTQQDSRAEIVKDSDGVLRRRDIDSSGVVTFTTC